MSGDRTFEQELQDITKDDTNDLMLKLHEYNIVIRNLQAENKVLKMKLEPTSSNNKKNS